MYVDFHSHILPGADHGSLNIKTSLAQLRYAKAAGVDTIVATPHFYIEEDSVESFLTRREEAFSLLRENNDSGIEIVKASEVQLAIGISELPDLSKLCIGDTKHILLEFPPEPWPYWMFDFVSDIIEKRGLSPIIAHIDRYSERGREKLLSLPAKFQMNAESVIGFGKAKRENLSLARKGSVHVLGSDTHGRGESSYKAFSKAVKKIGAPMEQITEISRKILAKGE
ncbi:MAG: capsular polysaccharide biosynthesis protein [Oscillospiraceae bacterium]|nr:capsular polysaccharide biosynthesis protein [Oscillospiraceae bacterium]